HREPAAADTLPTVWGFASKEGRAPLGMALVASGMGSKKDPQGAAATTAAAACRLFSNAFGRCSSDSLAVTEIPGSHGQSFPGLVHMSWAFIQTDLEELQNQPTPGSGLAFCGHEVAHQWWGNAVRPATYRDAWLSEGFAEYSGYLFVQQATPGDAVFDGLLDQARRHILDNRRRALGRGVRAEPPISLGTRSTSSMNLGDYGLLIYEKGAWVLHMLRCMLMDLRSGDESAFLNLMRDYYSRYRNAWVTTEDFRRVVEEHVGMDMGWFFDQWVHGTDVPVYEFQAGWSPQADGTYKVSGLIKQSEVPEGFQAYPIIRIRFGEEGFYQVRVLADKPHTTFTLAVPIEPVGVDFNDMNSVLADVRE
ncbi:MAG TPA: M1 family aminopeptidase, partial [bacterium]|nr:M1 family aminopeptidase [bacterium]